MDFCTTNNFPCASIMFIQRPSPRFQIYSSDNLSSSVTLVYIVFLLPLFRVFEWSVIPYPASISWLMPFTCPDCSYARFCFSISYCISVFIHSFLFSSRMFELMRGYVHERSVLAKKNCFRGYESVYSQMLALLYISNNKSSVMPRIVLEKMLHECVRL